jgi:hypothetical protein
MKIFATMNVTMNPSEIEEFDIQETYHNIPFLSKSASLDNCPNVNPKEVECVKFLISKLYGKTSHDVTYSQKEYKINFDGLKKKIGRYWPRLIEYYCYQNMLGLLRLILIAENYHEIDMEDAHCQVLTGIYSMAPAINKYHTKRKEIL